MYQNSSLTSLLPTKAQSTEDPPPDEEIQAITNHVESICYGIVTALNEHNFDPTSAFWRQSNSSSFRAEGGYLFAQNLDLEGYLLFWKDAYELDPGMHSRLLDVTTYVNREKGFAEVFCNTEVTGRPVGIVRKSVAILTFKPDKNGNWLCTNFKGVRGADTSAPGEVGV